MAELESQQANPLSSELAMKQVTLIQEKEELLKELKNAQRHIRRKDEIQRLQENIDQVEKEIVLAKDELLKLNMQRWSTIHSCRY